MAFERDAVCPNFDWGKTKPKQTTDLLDRAPLPRTSVLRAKLATPRKLSNPPVIVRRNPAELMALPVPSEALLHAYFDLTPAETRLAQTLALGNSLEETAAFLDIKMSTAKSQLASIFAKTNTCRQGKLVAILSRIAHLRS